MTPDQLPDHLIFLTIHGSHAYGTSTPHSDIDIRGVAIAPLSDYFLPSPWEQLQKSTDFTQKLLQQKKPECTEDADCEVFNLNKFVRLAADANPNILDILFAHPDDWLYAHPLWEQLYARRHDFLSMRVQHTYTGYAVSQLNRIKTHQRWLLSPPQHKPQRSDFGLPEHHALIPKDVQELAASMLHKQQQRWNLNTLLASLEEENSMDLRAALKEYFQMVHGRPYNPNATFEQEQAAQQIGLSEELWKRLEQERRYKQALNEWKQFQHWKKTRNPQRAVLEADFGYDTKHASHLVRLLLSAEELLRDQTLSVRHPYAVLLRDIRQGAWSYEQLMDWSTQQAQKIRTLAQQKSLPQAPNRAAIYQWMMRLILEFHDVSWSSESILST